MLFSRYKKQYDLILNHLNDTSESPQDQLFTMLNVDTKPASPVSDTVKQIGAKLVQLDESVNFLTPQHIQHILEYEKKNPLKLMRIYEYSKDTTVQYENFNDFTEGLSTREYIVYTRGNFRFQQNVSEFNINNVKMYGTPINSNTSYRFDQINAYFVIYRRVFFKLQYFFVVRLNTKGKFDLVLSNIDGTQDYTAHAQQLDML